MPTAETLNNAYAAHRAMVTIMELVDNATECGPWHGTEPTYASDLADRFASNLDRYTIAPAALHGHPYRCHTSGPCACPTCTIHHTLEADPRMWERVAISAV